MDSPQDEPIDDIFRESWAAMEKYFTWLAEERNLRQVEPMHALIAKFRRAQLDSKFRAGQSLHFLIISRAKKHGLGPGGDPAIQFHSFGEDRFRLTYCRSGRVHEEYDFELNTFDPETDRSVQSLLRFELS